MANSKLCFIFCIILSIVSPFMLFTIALHKQQHQHFLSLRIELDQLKSRVSLLESRIEKRNHELQSKEHDIARMEKMVLEKEEIIVALKNKDSFLQNGSPDANKGQINAYPPVSGLENQSFILAQWNNCWRPALDGSFQKILLKMSQALRDADACIETIKTGWMPVLKNQLLTFISNLKPHFDFLTAETVEAYHASKNMLLSQIVKLQRSSTTFMEEWIPVLKNQMLIFISNLKPHFDFLTSGTIEAYYGFKNFLLSHVVKLQRSATPFMQELHKYAKPYMNQISSMTKIYLDSALVSLGNLVKKISIFLHELWKG